MGGGENVGLGQGVVAVVAVAAAAGAGPLLLLLQQQQQQPHSTTPLDHPQEFGGVSNNFFCNPSPLDPPPIYMGGGVSCRKKRCRGRDPKPPPPIL